MYAHQVIADLESLIKTRKINDFLYKESIKIFLLSIKNSQQFFMGNFTDIKKPLETTLTNNTSLFVGASSQFARMPYKDCWFEFDHSDTDVQAEYDVPKRGMFVREIAKDLIWVWIAGYSKKLRKWGLNPQQYFISIGKMLSENKSFPKLFPHALGSQVCSNGVTQVVLSGSNVFPMPCMGVVNSRMSQEMMKDDTRDIYVLNASLLLLNCKNIKTEEVYPPAKLNKKRRKYGKQKLFTYKTLCLSLPTNKQNKENPHAGDPENHKRIHLCRGHFKIYTKSKPLLGKHTGVYWWQPHIRGNDKDGMISKSYYITAHPPANTAA